MLGQGSIPAAIASAGMHMSRHALPGSLQDVLPAAEHGWFGMPYNWRQLTIGWSLCSCCEQQEPDPYWGPAPCHGMPRGPGCLSFHMNRMRGWIIEHSDRWGDASMVYFGWQCSTRRGSTSVITHALNVSVHNASTSCIHAFTPTKARSRCMVPSHTSRDR